MSELGLEKAKTDDISRVGWRPQGPAAIQGAPKAEG